MVWAVGPCDESPEFYFGIGGSDSFEKWQKSLALSKYTDKLSLASVDRSFSGIGFFELSQVDDLVSFVSHHDRLGVVPAPKGPDVADVDQVAVLDREIGVVEQCGTVWLVADGKD